MGLLEQLFKRPEIEEQRNLSLTDYQQWVDLGLTAGTESGVSVSPSSAIKHTAVFACVRILAETLASLPLIMYERRGRGRQRAQNHYLYALLKDQPNEAMTSFEYRETLQGHLALWGNAYSLVDCDNAGRVVELWPLRPDRMLQITEENRSYIYHYQMPTGDLKRFSELQIWHLRGLGSDGRIGYSPIQLARQAIGLGMAAETFGARFFGNDARPGGVLEHPGTLGEEAHKHLRESWESRHGGLSRSHKIAILEEGLSYKEIGLPPEDAQFIETRKFQIQEIARLYRIPPHMLADLERATFSNIEHQSIEFVIHTMRPWLVRWEQSIMQNLMLQNEYRLYYPKFLVDALLRGDTQSRYEAYAQGRQNGWLSANDIRELEDMNPVEGGDVYLVPLNMIPAGSAGGFPISPGRSSGIRQELKQLEPREDALIKKREHRSAVYRHRLAFAHQQLFMNTFAKIVRRESNSVLKAAKNMLAERGAPEFDEWIRNFYNDDHKTFLIRQMKPIYSTYAEVIAAAIQEELGIDDTAEMVSFIEEYMDSFMNRYAGMSIGEIREVLRQAKLNNSDPLEALESLFEHWGKVRPDALSLEEIIRSSNALAWFQYGAAGILAMRWVAAGKSCPYCSQLDGRIIGMQEFFMQGGDFLEPDDGGEPLPINSSIRHPPIHKGCDCMIVASAL